MRVIDHLLHARLREMLQAQATATLRQRRRTENIIKIRQIRQSKTILY